MLNILFFTLFERKYLNINGQIKYSNIEKIRAYARRSWLRSSKNSVWIFSYMTAISIIILLTLCCCGKRLCCNADVFLCHSSVYFLLGVHNNVIKLCDATIHL